MLLALPLSLGCGHDHEDHDHNSSDEHEHQHAGEHNHQHAGEHSDTGSCAESSGECFQIGWEGTSELAKLTIVAATPEMPIRGINSWTIALSDLEGAPLTGCEVWLTPYMPEHGHGVATVPDVTEGDDGQYQVDQIELIMPGLWEMRFKITCEGWEDSERITYGIWLEA